MKYLIRHTTDLAKMDTGSIETYPWGGEYRPDARFKIGWTDEGLNVHLRSYESKTVATVFERNGNVCRDSCMEFFFSPSPDNSAGYFNFEINPNPTLLLHYGLTSNARLRKPAEWPIGDFRITCTKGLDDFGRAYWQLDYLIPFSFICSYVPNWKPQKGSVIRANLYKCGAIDQPSHFGTWNSIDTSIVPRPNFHTPDFFGEMELA